MGEYMILLSSILASLNSCEAERAWQAQDHPVNKGGFELSMNGGGAHNC